jgi:hypothetical protein
MPAPEDLNAPLLLKPAIKVVSLTGTTTPILVEGKPVFAATQLIEEAGVEKTPECEAMYQLVPLLERL